MQVLIYFLVGAQAIADVIAFVGVGLWLQFRPGRVVATIAALLGLGAVVVTILNQLGLDEGGNNVVVALIVGYSSLRAAIAAYRFPSLLKAESLQPADTAPEPTARLGE